MGGIGQESLETLLNATAFRYREPATLILLGGCALALLGSPRPTLDIDYVGDDLDKNELQQVIERTADELQIEIEAVPIDQFIPLPDGADKRKIGVGRYDRARAIFAGEVIAFVRATQPVEWAKLEAFDDCLLVRKSGSPTTPDFCSAST